MPGNGFEPRFHAGQEATDGPEAIEHRRVQRQHRRRFGHAIAFQDAQAELFQVGARVDSLTGSAPATT